jgi:hypothetical protein
LSSGLDERLVLEVVAKALDELGGLADPRRGAPGSEVIRALSGELVAGARKGGQKADELDSPLLEALLAECYGSDQGLLYSL